MTLPPVRAARAQRGDATVPRATFRFYEELNDHLPRERRRREFSVECARAATVKQAVEALGVPHTEVDLILVNGRSVDFSRRLRDGDRVAVFPCFEGFDIAPVSRLRPAPLRETRFVCDSHLGGLARLLRLLGFDTLYRNDYPDEEVVRLASQGPRIILTRDRELLKRRAVTHGCLVRAERPLAQLDEVVARLQLERSLRAFTRCLRCNAPLEPAGESRIAARVPASVRERHERFLACPQCGRVYWEGSHHRRMRALVDRYRRCDAPA